MFPPQHCDHARLRSTLRQQLANDTDSDSCFTSALVWSEKQYLVFNFGARHGRFVFNGKSLGKDLKVQNAKSTRSEIWDSENMWKD